MTHRLLLLTVVVTAATLGWWAWGGGGLDDPTRDAVDHFFATYVTEEGRVIRENGETVSEGQAYALLMAVATGRPRRFAAVWEWTRRHLLREDGAMAWLWRDGVVDRGLAPDADVDAAVALFLASDRFERPAYAAAGRRMAGAVLDAAAARLGGELHLTAGEWAHGDRVVVNPSYLDPASFDFLARHTGDARWGALAESSSRTLARLTDGSLPPDWAGLTADGIEPISSPDAGSERARFSFDALRVPLRLATSCTGALAAGMEAVWPRVQANPAVAVRHLDGTAAEEWEHPAALVGAAALAHRFDPALVRPLLTRAARREAEAPSYYGAALTALGRLLLTTDTLQRCP